ncbi:MAG: alpha-L-fucosidase [Planctomycetota bacterium]|jgi:alpha-L-fucosidase
MQGRKMLVIFLAVVLFVCNVSANVLGTGPVADDIRVKKLSELKFGMFICWSFSTFSDREWTRGAQDVAIFNPDRMDTDQWCKVAKEAGMNYILFLTKHHDGFCLWDTKTTEWKVTNSPLGKDVLAAVKKSCDKYGLKLALYFSEGDWTWIEPAKLPGLGSNAADFRNPIWREGKNAEMKKAQLKELCSEYGAIEFFWMDFAQGDGGLRHKETVDHVKSFQPNCFVGFNSGQVAGDLMIRERGLPGPMEDVNSTGVGKKSGTHSGGEKYLVAEFTMPMLGGNRWFYTNEDDKFICMPAEKIFRLYQGAVEYGNVFSLDVTPDRNGRLREIDIKTLKKVGEMIRKTKVN